MSIYYSILEIPENSNKNIIREAYKKLALKYHPDKNPIEFANENTKKFQQISEAYDILINTEPEKDVFEFMTNKYNKNVIKNNLSIYKEIELTLEDIYNGKTITLTYDKSFPKNLLCFSCKGSDTKCETCKNSNELIIQESNIQVSICPKFDKKTIFYDNAGHFDSYGNKGDLIINVLYKDHDIYTRKGDDLYIKINLSFKESLIGTVKTIKFLNNELIEVYIDGPIKNGSIIKLEKNGMNSKGSLYIKLKTEFPKKLTDGQKKVIEKYF